MDQHGVKTEKVPSSDCDEDEYEDLNLLTVINEHSEVIGLIEDDRDTNSQIGQNGVTDSNEIEIFHPHQIILNLTLMKLIPLMIIQMEMEMNLTGPNNSRSEVNEDDSDSEDQEHYMVYQEENNGIENNIHLPEIPIINYAGDVEHKEDFGNGWEWTEKDPGSSCGPFIGQPGLLIQPASHTPEGFLNLLFDNSMWTLLAQETNIYARQRIQQLRGIILYLFLYFCLQDMF